MRDIAVTISASGKLGLSNRVLGYQGETGGTRLIINVESWHAEGSTYGMTIQRDDGRGWTVFLGAVPEDGVISYVVNSYELGIEGCVRVQFLKNDGTHVNRSELAVMDALLSVLPSDPPADDMPAWYDLMMAAAHELGLTIQGAGTLYDAMVTEKEAAVAAKVAAETEAGSAAASAQAVEEALQLATADESARKAAELLREGAETDRETAEGLREDAEDAREIAEGQRDSAETAREAAEALRVAAETARMGFVPKGPYNPANENKYGEWYTHEGGSYGYIWPEPSTGVPLSDTSHWQQIAEKGLKGDPFEYEDFTPEQLAGLVGNGIKSILRTSGDGTPGTTDTYTITFDDDSTTTFPVYNGADGDISNIKVDGATKTKAAGVVDLTSDFARYALWRKTASGNPVSAYPVPESPMYPKVSGTFSQSGTGDPSPTNIRPITPWLASGATAKVKRTGKNLLRFENDAATLTVSGITRTKLSDGSYSFSGTASSAVLFYFREDTFQKVAGSTATFSPTPSGASISTFRLAIWSKTWGSIPNVPSNIYLNKYTFIAPNQLAIIVFAIESGVTVTNLVVKPQLELGSTDTTYEPYTESEITLTAPQEIAEGWMDNEGAGQVTWRRRVFNGTESLTGGLDLGDVFRVSVSYADGVSNGSERCSHFPTLLNYTSNSPHFYQYSGGAWLFIPKSLLSTNDGPGVKTYLAAQYASGTPVTVCYQLATPVSITPAIAPLTALPQVDRITPRQNVLTASTGQVELTYAKSPIRESDDIATAIAAL